jgi:hypothetical protein
MSDEKTLATHAGESRLEQLLRATGFPLGIEPTESDLLRAAEQLRRRKRKDLLRFLGRLIARSIRLGSQPGKELCSVNDEV